MGMHPGWKAIQAVAVELQWPSSYPEDFWVHDRQFLEQLDASRDFAWSIYDAGTHIYCGEAGEAAESRRHTKANPSLDERFYIFERGQLTLVSREVFVLWLEQHEPVAVGD